MTLMSPSIILNMNIFSAFFRVTVIACAAMMCGPQSAQSQDFSALARLDPAQSGAMDQRRGAEVSLYLSQPVPYRVFTLDGPRRLIVDFKEVDFRAADGAAFTQSALIDGARFGGLRPGWSRMILDLAAPVAVRAAGMAVNEVDGTARVTVELAQTSAEDFAARAGLPDDPDWAFEAVLAAPTPAPDEDGALVVVIDPGHGGVDPGATVEGVHEADVMLAFGRELQAALARIEGVQPVLTRTEDSFVSLSERLTLARQAGADLLVSVHADALEGAQATGASVYTLTEAAADAASQRMAERHDQSDVLAGVDLSGLGDDVALVLQDLMRLETSASSNRFADQLVRALRDTNSVLNSRPRRMAPLAVLNAADFPSVLIEVGFLSNPYDRARLTDAGGRAPLVAAVALAVERWAIEEAALAPLVRQ